MSEADTRVLVAGPDDEGERLDAFLAKRTRLSRARVQKLIDAGRVRVAGETARRWGRPIVMDAQIRRKVDALWPQLGL